MASQPDDTRAKGRNAEVIADTRRHLSERLSDPYLTDHDRWVLLQLGRFLSGIRPEAERPFSPER